MGGDNAVVICFRQRGGPKRVSLCSLCCSIYGQSTWASIFMCDFFLLLPLFLLFLFLRVYINLITAPLPPIPRQTNQTKENLNLKL